MLSLSEAPVPVVLSLAAFALLVVGPGLLVLALARAPRTSPLEHLVLAWAIGLPITASLVLWLGPVHADAGPACALALGVAGYALAWRGRRPDDGANTWRDDVPLWMMLPFALVILAPYVSWGEPVDGGFHLTSFYDHQLHIASLYELQRGIPPQEMPYFAGKPWWPYHNGADAIAYLPFNYLDVDPLVAHDYVLRGVSWLVIALGAGVVVRRLTGNRWAGALTIAAFASSYGIQSYLLYHLGGNSPSAVALSLLPGVFLTFSLHARAAPDERARNAALVGLSAAGLLLTKANFFLMFLPGLLAAGVVLLARRQVKDAVAAVVGGTVIVLPAAIYLLTRPDARGTGIQYGAFSDFLNDQGELLTHHAANAPEPLRVPLTLALWFATAGGWLWPLLVVGIISLSGRRRGFRPAHGFVLGALAGALFVGLFLVQKDGRQYTAWNVAGFLLYPLRLLALIGAGVGAANLASRLPEQVRRLGPVLLLIVFGGHALTRAAPDKPIYGGVFVPDAWLGAARVLREQAPLDAVVLTYASMWGSTSTSAFTGRRVFLERPVLMFAPFVSTAERLADLEIIFSSNDENVVHALLAENRITHIIEVAIRPLRLADGRGLELLYEADDVRLWRVVGLPETRVDRAQLDDLRRRLSRRMHAILRTRTGENARDVVGACGCTQRELYDWNDRINRLEPLADDLIAAPETPQAR